jgi:hypothetical protein
VAHAPNTEPLSCRRSRALRACAGGHLARACRCRSGGAGSWPRSIAPARTGDHLDRTQHLCERLRDEPGRNPRAVHGLRSWWLRRGRLSLWLQPQPIAPYNGSEFDLYVSAKNGAGQISQPSKFQIETILPAGNVAALAWWKLNSGHGNRADDSTGHGHLAKLSGHASLRCGSKATDSYRCWLSLAPSGGQAVTSKTVLPIVGNNGSFAVSAWVRVAACAAACVALSEDATKTSGFTLSYQRSCAAGGHTGPCWRFSMPKTDSKSAFVYRASSTPGTAHVSKWVELTGVFNASHGALTLYVNGVEAGQVTGAAPWTAPAPGPVRLGRMLASGAGSPWDGQISNVCMFYGVLQPADIKLLYSGNSTHPHNGCAALHARYSQ